MIIAVFKDGRRSIMGGKAGLWRDFGCSRHIVMWFFSHINMPGKRKLGYKNTVILQPSSLVTRVTGLSAK